MRKQDWKLLISLMLWSLVPSIYLLIRMNIVAVNSVDINILGQMEWFDLIDEILLTTFTVPLYFLLKPEKATKEMNTSAFILSMSLYTVFTVVMDFNISKIAAYMNAEYAVQYLFLQSISMLIGFISTFMIILFTLNDSHGIIYTLILSKVGLLVLFDFMFIPPLSDIGASYSEITTNIVLAVITISIAWNKGYLGKPVFYKKFIQEWAKKGIFVGIQIFLDNFIYAIMICKMVNAVSESGNYWVANNFIWGWLLVPITCLVEIIKKNNVDRLTFFNCWEYVIELLGLWVLTLPLWPWFLTNVMAVNAKDILQIVLPLIPFYLAYMGSAVIDGWFVSQGKTIYNAVNSFLVNIVYYGIVYLLFRAGVFSESIGFIIGMFGFGMVFHLIISYLLYKYEFKFVGKKTEVTLKYPLGLLKKRTVWKDGLPRS